ncbi:hypothetical protein [Pseudoalteromonas sp. ZZD1]|uniref:hypothetical protein n=1 Tax=Pseudoalteromonas sp. ZZD1 TaxID=3139395 RepID=UPI003BAB199F
MNLLFKLASAAVIFSVLSGCQNHIENPEMQQCAQQNYQCELNCEQQSTGEGMVHKVCSTKCIETYNQCKANAEALGAVQ